MVLLPQSRSISFLLSLMLLLASLVLAGTIDEDLQKQLKEARPGETFRVMVLMKEQVDLKALDYALKESRASLQYRHQAIVEALQDKAATTQADLLSLIQNFEDQGKVVFYQSFWIVNSLNLEATREVIEAVAKHPSVARVSVDWPIELEEPVSRRPAPVEVNSAEVGLKVINAHKLWARGYTGQGTIVMNIDTGVDGTHPALAARWRGNQPGVPASAAWFDPNFGSTQPQDTDGHGTHTMGTMTGLDPATNDTIGVAFGAQWIAARTLFANPHTSASVSAFQWAADPDGNPATVNDVPAAISNSWFDPNVQAVQCDSNANPYYSAITAVEAVGAAVVFSAGNSGPGSATITSPKNAIWTPVNIWATGALDGNNPALPIANFSSRGPSICDGVTIKPEASAPGVNVRSSLPGNGYGFLSGTSMASPHVAGAIALLRSVAPNMTGTELKYALLNTARDLGAPGEDNDYGMGVIDVYAAFLTLGDSLDPNPPDNVSAYSDYTTPTSIQLTWTDPTSFVGGDPLLPSDFMIMIERDSILIDSVNGGVQQYVDTGLMDGVEYHYALFTKVISTDSTSRKVTTSWFAGGHPVPNPPTQFFVTQAPVESGDLVMHWTNPSTNLDGTPMDDLDHINLYEDSVLVATFTRSPADTGKQDSAVYTPPAGTHQYYVTAVDNEVPPNESAPSNLGFTPISVPFFEDFPVAGPPNPAFWQNVDAEVNDVGANPPSPPYSLNLNGNPNGGDIVTMLPVDLSGKAGQGLIFSYWWEPQGNGELPDNGDSLIVEFLNDQGQWIKVAGYNGGTGSQNFTQAILGLDLLNPGPGATFFHPQFQARFRSLGTAGPFDDWFVDDVFLGKPTNNPLMAVSPDSLNLLLLVGAVDTVHFTISNNQPLPSSLNFTVTESPDLGFLTVDPAASSVPSNQSLNVNVIVDASTQPVGTYMTDLIVAGNDTTNSEDTVHVTVIIQEAPLASIHPDTFDVVVASDTTVTDTLTIANSGQGILAFSITSEDLTEGLESQKPRVVTVHQFNPPVKVPAKLRRLLPPQRKLDGTLSVNDLDVEPTGHGSASQVQTEGLEDLIMVGGWANTFSGGSRDRGNFYEVTKKVRLREHWFHLNPSAATDIYFFVYEGASLTGTYNLVSVVQKTAQGPGEDWYKSGPVNVTLFPGNYYYIGAAWIESSTYGSSPSSNPLPLSFGTLQRGQPSSLAGIPPGNTINNSGNVNSVAYYQALDIATTANWLGFSPDSGTVSPGDSVDVVVTFDPTGLLGGDYFGRIKVNTNDPLHPVLSAGVHMFVLAKPNMALRPDSLWFDTLLVGQTQSLPFWVVNAGAGPLTVSSVASTDPTFQPDTTAFTVPPLDSQKVMVTFTPPAEGSFGGWIVVTSDDPDTPVDSIWVHGEAIAPPVMVTLPDSMSFTLGINEADSSLWTIANTGLSPLEFVLSEEEASESMGLKLSLRRAGTMEQFHTPRYPKGAEEPSFAAQTEGAGGPDAFGYRWIDSDEPNGPAFQFIDISGTGTVVQLQPTGSFDPKDEGMATINLPWPVNFYGTSYTQLQVNSNGFVTFDMNFFANAFSNTQIPDPGDPNNLVAVFWDDLDGSTNGDIYYQQIGNMFIIQWHQWDHFPSSGSDQMDFEIIFYQNSSTIDFAYSHVVEEASSTYGIENADASIGLQIAYNQAYSHDQLLTRIFRGVDWLSENPDQGTVQPGDSLQVVVTAKSTGLLGGNYHAKVIASSNDPANPTDTLDVWLTVIGIPDIAANPTAVAFDTTFVGQSAQQGLWVVNRGTGVLTVNTVEVTHPFFAVDTTSFQVDPLDSLLLQVTYAPGDTGTHSGFVEIVSDDPDTDTLQVPVSGVAVPAPEVAVNPSSIQAQLNEGDSTDVVLTIANNGGSNLSWSAGVQFTKFKIAESKRVKADLNRMKPSADEAGEHLVFQPVNMTEALGDTLFTFDVQTPTGDNGILGVEFAGGYFWITGRNASGGD
ncbi:MAG: choice-of-anchor D domain-containing protein, partial [Calditrichaeota bacterium]